MPSEGMLSRMLKGRVSPSDVAERKVPYVRNVVTKSVAAEEVAVAQKEKESKSLWRKRRRML